MVMSAAPFLSHRARRPEIMDRVDLDPGEHAAALRGLGRINRLSFSSAALARALIPLARGRTHDNPLRVLDVASGGGDVPIALARRAARNNVPLIVDGCDISPRAVAFARQAAQAAGVASTFLVCDALNEAIPEGYDVITSTLFLHHLDEGEAVTLLRRMSAAAERAVVIDDLVRNRLGYALAWAGCRLLSRSRVVHHDGPVSVASAFTPAEVLDLAAAAGLDRAQLALTRHWPQRFLLTWTRP